MNSQIRRVLGLVSGPTSDLMAFTGCALPSPLSSCGAVV
jgi:hypothetical protein